MKTVLVLGGYGNFGKRIVEDLADMPETTLLIAGRNSNRAQALAEKLEERSRAQLKAVKIDIDRDDFETNLRGMSPDLVIHTSGPFQGQDYRVPATCIDAGAHYIDLADDRRFVCDITTLDGQAKARGVVVVSGASSVPGLSSAVIDSYRNAFSAIDSIDISIAPGNKAERGAATVTGILSYTGHPFKVFTNGQWRDVFGWMDPTTRDFGDIVGKRCLANVDIPDLELFPQRYAVNSRVTFQAGLELRVLHYAMVTMGYLAKTGIVKTWAPFSNLIMKTSALFNGFGTDIGGMQIEMAGKSLSGESKSVRWTLYAPNGIGPYIPTLPAVIVTRKILAGELAACGATPCLGLFGLDDFEIYAKRLKLYFTEQRYG